MKILLSNDDGYYSSGMQFLINELSVAHDIFVAAPSSNQSAGSSALSVRKDILVENVSKNHYVINGTPADCVHIALTCLIKEEIDIVVSGINLGANLGDDVIYSGTVAAALEGRHLKMSPIAISLVSSVNMSIKKSAEISKKVIDEIICNKIINKNTLLNVNIPDTYKDLDISEIEYTRLGVRDLPLPATKIINKNNYYRIGGAGTPKDNGKKTDFFAIENNKISISPILYNLTNKNILEKLSI